MYDIESIQVLYSNRASLAREMMNMTKTYDIRKIDELHRLRSDIYEERKHLTPSERRKISNNEGRRVWEKVQAMRQIKKTALLH